AGGFDLLWCGRELTSFLLSPQYEVSGEEHLYSDFPEIDLSQLDTSDLDSAGCFSELQWCAEHSETESSQYSTDDSELFQIIDSENEALLAALTETLDDIQGADVGLAAFRALEEGDTLNHAYTSPAPSPKPAVPVSGGPPPAPEVDELSLVRTHFLLVPQAQSRSCTELHRHLTSAAPCAQTSASRAPEECPSGHHHPAAGDCAHHEDSSDSSEDSLSSGDAVTSPSLAEDSTGSRFSCDGEMHTVVELIRYMHTYCLPPRKLPARDATDAKPQPCSSPFKRSRPGCAWQAAGGCKKPAASFSILKELLARDLLCDVSKPYRLGKPVYASLARPPAAGCPAMLVQDGADTGGTCKSRAKVVPEKTEPRQSLGAEAEAPREPGSLEEEAGKCVGAPAVSTGKAARRPESTVYTVRRSKRLNPELGHWLSLLDEPPLEPSVPQEAPASREPTLCPLLEAFSAEEPAAEVEVGGTEEGDGGSVAPPAEPQPLVLASPGGSEVGEGAESQHCAPRQQAETPRCLTLSLAQTDPTFGKRNFEPMLTVELCGTAGLTPPTTPPYKPAEEDLYKPDIPQEAGKEDSTAPSPGAGSIGDTGASQKAPKKHPERTELLAHLSRAAEQPGVLKRPFSCSFGDHDYCQVLKPEATLQRKVLKSWEPPGQTEMEHKRRVPDAHYQGLDFGGKEAGSKMVWKDGVKQLRDQEIRASLTKHFGFLDSALDNEDMAFCKTPEYDTVFDDSCSESGSPAEEEEEEDEEEEEHCDSPLDAKLCLRRNPFSRTSLHYCSRSRSSSGSSCCRSRSPTSRRTFRYGWARVGSLRPLAWCWQGEGRVVYVRNLSSNMSSSELKKRFEVFGEIVECQVLSRTNRGDKYGFITYRYSEHAALSLKNGTSLRKRNEPSFQLSSGGLGHFFWTRYADLDCSAEESSPAPVKSKYETMDFDSLLQEAQLSLHR
uniref:PPARG coactivator 1 beta n=1 Tax=Anser brachyrhynchus TaxID=132585 RepID=A0A8B9C2R8_9AVES